MRLRLILEHGGHAITKRVELPEVPAVGSVVLADRERRVVSVAPVAERGDVDVYVREDGDDIKMQVIPEAHLAYVELMKRDGWDVEEEAALRAWLRERISRQGRDGPVDLN
ncbi:hypothetical protein BE04_14775 [Sorangium cellulosum]|uniref:Uncharacterized protein n=2 Tax=Sorangium cellulosum TaxID=56 RepID=A0A150P479_SORCE|nr:hypothetical protein [Sorangium cellulosum]AGP42391.1 hypothetical protein SCE1572_52535 [Sorangium cellulosum So0157-2]KYF50298.1 hypothetical protein BE04_14775 [Sorangium cellulosum]